MTIDNFDHLLSVLITNPEKELKAQCLTYYQKNIKSFTDEEILCVYDLPILKHEKKMLAKIIEDKVNKSIPVNQQLLLKLVSDDISQYNPKKLHEGAYQKGLLKNVDNPTGLLQQFLDNKKLSKTVKNKAILETSELLEIINKKDRRFLNNYLDGVVKHNNIEQLEIILKFDNELSQNAYSTKEDISKEASKIFLQYKNDIEIGFLRKLHVDVALDYIDKHPDIKIDSFYPDMYHPALTEKVIQTLTNRFLKAPRTATFIGNVLDYGNDFYSSVGKSYDATETLSQITELDLGKTLKKFDNDSQQYFPVKNFIKRKISLNSLQEMMLTNKSTDFSQLLLDYMDLVNMPIIEKINGIDFKKDIIDFAFFDGSYNHIVKNIKQVMHIFSDEQHQKIASIIFHEFYHDEQDGWLDILHHVPKDKIKIYKEINEIFISELDNNPLIKKVLSEFLNVELSSKDENKKAKI